MRPLAWPLPNGNFRAEVYIPARRGGTLQVWRGGEHPRRDSAVAEAQSWVDAQDVDTELAQRALDDQP